MTFYKFHHTVNCKTVKQSNRSNQLSYVNIPPASKRCGSSLQKSPLLVNFCGSISWDGTTPLLGCRLHLTMSNERLGGRWRLPRSSSSSSLSSLSFTFPRFFVLCRLVSLCPYSPPFSLFDLMSLTKDIQIKTISKRMKKLPKNVKKYQKYIGLTEHGKQHKAHCNMKC